MSAKARELRATKEVTTSNWARLIFLLVVLSFSIQEYSISSAM